MNSKASPARLAALKALLALEGKPGAAARAAHEADDEHGAPAAGPGLEPRERALAERLTKGALRRRLLIDALLRQAAAASGARFSPEKTPLPNLWALRLAAFEKIWQGGAPDYAIGAQAVELARARGGEPAARFVNALARRLLPALPAGEAALAAGPWAAWLAALPAEERLSIPGEIIAEYESAYGAAAAPALAALADGEAATWLRVNTLKMPAERAAAELQSAGTETVPGPQGLAALRWTEGTAPWRAPVWGAGGAAVQDLAAQLAGALLAPRPGEAVADLCAAPGGKTGHLWELMRGEGRLTAWEADPARRALLCENFERLHGRPAGVAMPEEAALSALVERLGEGSCSAVLLDAPCQALGLIRRRPEARWDGRLRNQATIQRVQRDLLRQAARLTAPGGRLLWVTCSPTQAENEQVAGPFLAENPEWRAVESAVPPALREAVLWQAPLLRTRPDQLPWDGFAYCLLTRVTQ